MDSKIRGEAGKLVALGALIALHLAASAAFMSAYCAHLHLDTGLIPRHVTLVLAGWLVLLGTTGFGMYWWGNQNHRRCYSTVAFVLWILFSAQTVVYVVDWYAVAMMGETVTLGLFATFTLQIRDAIRLSPVPLSLAIACFCVVQCVCILAALGMSVVVCNGVAVVCAPEWRPDRPRARHRRILTSLGFIATVICPPLMAYLWISAVPYSWEAEPFTGFFSDPLERSKFASEDRTKFAADRAFDSYPKGLTFQKRDVILVFIDDLRADHMSIYGYKRPTTPFLDSLMRVGHLHRVEMALATQPSTRQSLTSMLSSRLVPSIRMDNLMLTDALYNQGYSVTFVVSGEWGQYVNIERQLGRGIYNFIEGIDSPDYPVGDDRMVPAELSKLPDHGDVPALLFLSLLSPHPAGYRQDEYNLYKPDSMTGLLIPNAATQQEYRNHYDNGIVQTDAILEQVFGILRKKGFLENGLVIIFSDHGEELGDHGEYGHGGPLYQSSLRVPLLIYEEDPVTYANLSFASLLDIPPTVLDRLGLPIPDCFEGRSMLKSASQRVLFHFSSHSGSRQSWAATYWKGDDRHKYIRKTRGASQVEQFFDLNNDPDEQHDIISTANPETLRYLRERLDDQFAPWRNENRFLRSGFTYAPSG